MSLGKSGTERSYRIGKLFGICASPEARKERRTLHDEGDAS